MQVSLSHFQTMMGPFGLFQHATGQEPLLLEGYCTDDNARAVQWLTRSLALAPVQEKEQFEMLLARCWQFLLDAKRPDGTWYNFRSANGDWLPHDISADMYARLARAASIIIRSDANATRQREATDILTCLEPVFYQMTALRGWSEINLALSLLPQKHDVGFDTRKLMQTNIQRLLEAWQKAASPDWPWFENVMTYANALIPHGLLASRGVSPSPLLEEALGQSTAFLVKSTMRGGIFTPIGSLGWYPRDGNPSSENQQPIEAGTMFEFILAYQAQFPDRPFSDIILRPYLWFFGANTNKQVMANAAIGASYDGLFTNGPNTNFGAESMLAYLTSELLLATTSPAVQTAARRAREKLER